MRTLRLALRSLRRTPLLTAVAATSIALGIGANAAVFSVFRQLLLRPLPAREPARLVNLSAPGPKDGMTSSNAAGPTADIFSAPMFRDLERAAPRAGLAGLAAHRTVSANLAFAGRTQPGRAALVSGSYFPVLGLTPALGRLLGPQDDGAPGASPVAVLSYPYWSTQLGSDPAVVGRTLVVNGRPLTVVGVAPAGFTGTTLGNRPEAFVPLAMQQAVARREGSLDDRQSYWLYLFGRLAPGATVDGAHRALDAVYRPILRDVEASQQAGASARYLAEFRARHLGMTEGAHGQSRVPTFTALPLRLLLATSGVVLLIACANVANLLLARGAARAGEMAVRMSLGAGRRRLVGQLLAESAVLALLGTGLGLVVARWTLVGLSSTIPVEAAGTFHATLDWQAVAFAAATALAAGLLAGVVPALQSTRPDLIARVRASAGQIAGGSRAASRFRTGLVGAQVGLSMLLLVTAALFLRSLTVLNRADLGIAPEGAVTFIVSPSRNGYPLGRARAFFDRLHDALAATPGVTAVAAGRVPMLSDDNSSNDVRVEGFRGGPDVDANASYNAVAPGYFRTLGVPLLAGRDLAESDRLGTPKVAVVNEAFVRKFGLGRGAVGKRLGAGGGPLDLEIVGVVRDAKYSTVRGEVPPVYFTPYAQDSVEGPLTFYVRTAGDAAPLLRTVTDVVHRLDPDLPLAELRTLPAQVRENTFLERMVGRLAGAFAALATVLAGVGLYGVLAYTVAQRTRELGLRMALGATGRAVRALVLGQVGRIVVVGGALGLLGALALGRAARALLYGVASYDPPAIAAAVAVIGMTGLAAGYLPARRAARVDPTAALRAD